MSCAGRRLRRSLKTGDKSEALRRATLLLQRLHLEGGEAGRVARLSPREVIALYLADRREGGASAHSLRAAERATIGTLAHLGTLRACTPGAVLAGFASLARERRWLPNTRVYYRHHLCAFFSWLRRRGLIEANPASVIRIPRGPGLTPRRAMTQEEASALLASSPAPRAACYGLALGAGLRRREMRLLEWRDLDLARAVICLRSQITKNRRPATLPISPWLLSSLRAWQKKAPALKVLRSVPDPRTLRLDLIKAGIPPLTSEGKIDIHSLRVTFCTLLARSGVPVRSAQLLMRHSSPSLTLQVYTKMTGADLADAASAINLGSP